MSIFTLSAERAILGGTVAALLGIHLALATVENPSTMVSTIGIINFTCLLAFILINFTAAIVGDGEKNKPKPREKEEPLSHPSWFFSDWEK